MFQKNELKLLWPFYLDALISYLLFFLPAFQLVYFISLNFSMFQIGLFFSITSIFSLLFEIPTGAFADLYGRKKSVLLGFFIESIACLGIYFFTNFYVLLVLSALLGIGFTFSSGAREAWVTDLIKNRNGLLKNYFVKIHTLTHFCGIFSGLLGALVVKFLGVASIWLFGSFSLLLSIIILLNGQENFVKKKIDIKNSFKNFKKQSLTAINYSRKHHVLFLFLIAGTMASFVYGFEDLAWIPLLKNLGFEEYHFGYLWAMMSLIGMIASLVSSKLFVEGKERLFMITTICIGAFFTMLILFVNSLIPAILILFAGLFFSRVGRPARRLYFHRFIPSRIRASVGSLESMLVSATGIISAPLGGLAVDFIGPQNTIFLSGILLIIPAFIYFKIKNDHLKCLKL